MQITVFAQEPPALEIPASFQQIKGTLINDRFQIQEMIAARPFYNICTARDTQTNNEVLMKFEEKDQKFKFLAEEGEVIRNLQGIKGIPTIIWTGSTGLHNFLVFQRMTCDVEFLYDLRNQKNGQIQRLDAKTMLMIADEMLHLLEKVHDKGYIINDIQPLFIWMAGEKADDLYYTDFEYCQSYISPETGEHVPESEGDMPRGSIRFMSINNQRGMQTSRRDDLESLGYVLLYLVRGYLPWQGFKAKTILEKYDRMVEKKIEERSNILEDKRMEYYPTLWNTERNESDYTMRDYLKYCYGLQFDEKPDYAHLRGLFKDMFARYNCENNGIYCWNNNKKEVYNNRYIKIFGEDLYKDIESVKEQKHDPEPLPAPKANPPKFQSPQSEEPKSEPPVVASDTQPMAM